MPHLHRMRRDIRPYLSPSRPSSRMKPTLGTSSPAGSKRSSGSTFARASPAQIVAIHFREGALVKAGDSLVTIDPAPYATEVDRLNGVVAAAQAQVVFTKADVARARQIIGNALSERELDTRANAYDAATANLKSAEAALQTAKLNLAWTEVRAPVSGRAGRREITVGNLVEAGPNAPLLTTLVSVNPDLCELQRR